MFSDVLSAKCEAHQAASGRTQCSLDRKFQLPDHIEITFGLDIVVVSNSSKAQRFIVLVTDTDHATPESFDGVFTLEFD